ncbi:MAG: restriction endonuclease subunit S [Capsulimonadaceae bacterium]
MGHIDELIMEHCPNGVEFKPLREVSTFNRGTAITERQAIPGDIPVVANGPVPTYTHSVANRKGGTIVVARSGAYAGLVSYWNQPIFLTDAFSVHPDTTVLDPKFVYYLLQNNQDSMHSMKKGAGVPHVRVKEVEAYSIPIPPIEVQQEIVKVLDTFSKLEARRRQYTFYRDQLLTYDGGITWATLPEVSINRDSSRKPVTKSVRTTGDVRYYGASGIVDYVSEHIFEGDYLLVSEDGANLLARSAPIAFSVSGKSWVNNHAHVLEFPTYAQRRFVEIYLNSINLAPYVSGG